MNSHHANSGSTAGLVIRVRDLSVTKGGRVICRVSALDVSAGERIGVEGANGSGKSTLLRVLSELERDFSGNCMVDIAQRDRVFVHQTPYLFRGTVLQNVMYGLVARSVKKTERRRMAHEWLEKLDVAELANRQVEGLSGGECRRVAIARACVLRPKLLILDEPLAELDESGANRVRTAIEELSESTVLIASPISLPADLVARSLDLSSLCSVDSPNHSAAPRA